MKVKFLKTFKYDSIPNGVKVPVTIKKGTVKEFRDGIAKNLIRQGIVKEID